MKIGNREFSIGKHTYIMGILNMTPDSFSDGGKYRDMDKALFRAGEMISEGAAILDVGGESTRPGAVKISAQEEMERVLPLLERLKDTYDIPLSLDTYKGEVAAAGIRAGADMINDVSGLSWDPAMAGIIAESGSACCLMHSVGEKIRGDVMDRIRRDFEKILKRAEQAGIEKERIVLDPGIGFGKDYPQNLEVIRRIGQLQELGYPVLLGTSRKSVIGITLKVPVEERLTGTLVTGVMGILGGCAFLRVHDVRAHVEAVRMTEAILYGGEAVL